MGLKSSKVAKTHVFLKVHAENTVKYDKKCADPWGVTATVPSNSPREAY